MFMLWLGQFVSLAGDWLLIVALPFYVFQLTGSILQTGGMLMAEMLPRVLLGSIAGVFVDRWDRRWTMIVSDLIRAGVLLLLLLVHTRNLLWLIYVVAVIQSSVSQFFMPAVSAIIPSLVGEQELVAANSLNSFNDAVTRFIGPPLGGILLAAFGLTGVVIGDSASFLFSALTILLISVSARVTQGEATTMPVMTKVVLIWSEWLDGLRLVTKNKIITGIFLSSAIFMLGQGFMNVLLVIFVKEVMHRDAIVYGWLITSQGVGSLLGALLVGYVSKVVRPVYLLGPPYLLAGIAVLILVNYPILGLAIALIAIVGVFIVGLFVVEQTLLQQSVADNYRGRIFGTFNTSIAFMMLIGMALASTLGAGVGVVPLLEIAGGCLFVAGLVALVLLRAAKLSQLQSVSPSENVPDPSLEGV
jgi:MFS family permease